MLTKRQTMIVDVLLEKNTKTTGKELASILSLSEKTILTELRSIDFELQKKGYGKVIRTRGVGIHLDFFKPHGKKEFLKDYHASSTDDDFSYLFKKLFLKPKEKIITEKYLKQELFVSRNYLAQKIVSFNKTCQNYQVVIKKVKNHGLAIHGSEFAIRDAIIEIFFQKYLFPTEIPINYHFFNEQQEKDFKKIFGDFNKLPIEKLILELEKNRNVYLDHYSRNALLLHISLAIIRERLGYQINYTEKQKDFFPSFIPTQKIKLQKYFKKAYGVCPSWNELAYIYLYLDIYGLLTSDSFSNQKAELKASRKFTDFTEKFLNLMEGILDIDLAHDDSLRLGVQNHLSATILRLVTNIRIHNPLLHEVKHNFSLVYKTTWASSLLFDQYYGVTINEDEIAYLALYIGIAKEKKKQEISACLIVNKEDQFSKILSEQIKNIHPSLSLTCLNPSEDYQNFDLIISPLNLIESNSIQISKVLTENDKITILSKVKEMISSKVLSKKTFQEKNTTGLDKRFIFLNYPHKNKNDLIEDICSFLEKSGYVYKNYAHSVIKRENSVSTEIGSMVAIPHGNSKLVKQSIITYINLDEPIHWTDSDLVKHIFFLVISEINDPEVEKTIRNFYRTLIRITEDNSILLLDHLNDKDAVINFFAKQTSDVNPDNRI